MLTPFCLPNSISSSLPPTVLHFHHHQCFLFHLLPYLSYYLRYENSNGCSWQYDAQFFPSTNRFVILLNQVKDIFISVCFIYCSFFPRENIEEGLSIECNTRCIYTKSKIRILIFFSIVNRSKKEYCYLQVIHHPLDRGHKLNIYKTFRRGRWLNAVCRVSLRHVFKGYYLLGFWSSSPPLITNHHHTHALVVVIYALVVAIKSFLHRYAPATIT